MGGKLHKQSEGVMITCPQCGSPTSHLAGIVLYENRNRDAYPHSFDVCWKDGIHRQRGQQEWSRIGSIVARPKSLQWTVHSAFHWSMWLHGTQLNYWPTKRKIGWKNQIRKGYSAEQALDLAERINANPEASPWTSPR